jgi:hypothetical protein
MNPLNIPGLAQLPGLVEQNRSNALAQLMAELEARQNDFRQIYEPGNQVPLEVMPNARVNKGAAIAGGIAALIGALTGDRSAMPGFAQFAGGLQQSQAQQQQRLMQEQLLRRQQAQQEIDRKKALLGFDLELAQNKYQTEAQRIQAQRKLEFDAREGERDRQGRESLARINQEALTGRAQLTTDASIKRAQIAAVPKAQMEFDSLIAAGVEPGLALDRAWKLREYLATVAGKEATTEFTKARTQSTIMDTSLKQPKFDLEKAVKESKMANDNRRTAVAEQNANTRASGGGSGRALAPSTQISRNPEIAKLELRADQLELEQKGHAERGKSLEAQIKELEKFVNAGGPTAMALQPTLTAKTEEYKRVSARAQELKRTITTLNEQVLKIKQGVWAKASSGNVPVTPNMKGLLPIGAPNLKGNFSMRGM